MTSAVSICTEEVYDRQCYPCDVARAVTLTRRTVEVRDGDRVLATGRWTGRAIVDRSGSLGAADESAAWHEIENGLAAEERAALAEASASAYDANGVDLTLIDWMLAMTPTERLRALERHAAGLAPFVRE